MTPVLSVAAVQVNTTCPALPFATRLVGALGGVVSAVAAIRTTDTTEGTPFVFTRNSM